MSVSETVLINAGLQAGLFDAELLARMRPLARAQRMSLIDALARELRMPLTALWHALAETRGLPFLRAGEVEADRELIGRLPASLLQTQGVLPVRDGAGRRWLLVANPEERSAQAGIARATGETLPLALAEPEELGEAIRAETGRAGVLGGRGAGADDPVALFDRLLKEAWLRRASDIHVEPGKESCRIRLRVDGVMQPWGPALARPQGEGLVSRIKVLAAMDIAETRATQDGGMAHRIAGWDGDPVDLRVASIPTRFGERVTLRILKSDAGPIGLDALGMPPFMLEALREVLARPHGIVLVTGPTGSGKSTTLYAALRELDLGRLNVLTVEDPIEQFMAGVSQVQVSAKVGFAGALRSFLRHDPDVVLVGEVRDFDTADTALKAATTGHLVLSTLHTNSALGVVSRLADIGCERYLLADTLVGAIAQRLVRRLCRRCRREVDACAEARALLGVAPGEPLRLYEPGGCPACVGTGYAGRIGVFESLWMDGELADAVARGAAEGELLRHAHQLYRLVDDARAKVRDGHTSFAEARPLLGRAG
jgi:type IV pilus assembly protein PilB